MWDLLHKFEKEGLFDLTKLINGSQGTLGVITSIDFSLVPVVKHKKLLAVTLKNFEVLPQVVNTILGFKPVCCESYDDHTFILAEKYMSKDSAHVISNKDVVLTIIAEFGSDNDEEVTRIVEEAELALVKLNLKDAIQTVIVNEEKKRKVTGIFVEQVLLCFEITEMNTIEQFLLLMILLWLHNIYLNFFQNCGLYCFVIT